VKLLALGIGAAFAAFGLTFRGPRARFWDRMTATGLVLGGLALAADRDARSVRIGPREIAVGLATAAGLYGIFRVGDTVAREVIPRGGEEIGDIYELRSLRSKEELAVRLGLVIGPAEELFWRGFVQGRAVGVPLGALVVSHVAWDIWIFLVAPTEPLADMVSRRQAEE